VDDAFLSPLLLSLRLAAVSTVVLLAAGTPLAWWLARTRSALRPAFEAIVALPLVLPPTVLGFYLLLALGPEGPIGSAWSAIGGGRLVFSFTGLVVGSVLYSLPFVVQPLQAAFEALGPRPLEVAATLGASPVDRFVTIALPLTRQTIVAAATLGFAHTLGEFGVVLMIGGNIPGETRVASIAVYDQVEALRYADAHRLAAVLLGVSFVLVLGVALARRRARTRSST
jgi:molybdate transport system permease protein